MFIDGFDGTSNLRFSLDNITGNSLVHHSEAALTQFSDELNLLARYLPVIGDVGCTNVFRIHRGNEFHVGNARLETFLQYIRASSKENYLKIVTG